MTVPSLHGTVAIIIYWAKNHFTLLLCIIKENQCSNKHEYQQPVLPEPHLKMIDFTNSDYS